MVETYLSATLATLILLLPLVIWRMERTTWAVAILTDVLLVCNLMYFRTYYTAIPPDSYLLVGNLRDFTDSVWESLKINDALSGNPDFVLLPDEPYPFTATDGPEALGGVGSLNVRGRSLFWYGPAMVEARADLEAAMHETG